MDCELLSNYSPRQKYVKPEKVSGKIWYMRYILISLRQQTGWSAPILTYFFVRLFRLGSASLNSFPWGLCDGFFTRIARLIILMLSWQCVPVSLSKIKAWLICVYKKTSDTMRLMTDGPDRILSAPASVEPLLSNGYGLGNCRIL